MSPTGRVVSRDAKMASESLSHVQHIALRRARRSAVEPGGRLRPDRHRGRPARVRKARRSRAGPGSACPGRRGRRGRPARFDAADLGICQRQSGTGAGVPRSRRGRGPAGRRWAHRPDAGLGKRVHGSRSRVDSSRSECNRRQEWGPGSSARDRAGAFRRCDAARASRNPRHPAAAGRDRGSRYGRPPVARDGCSSQRDRRAGSDDADARGAQRGSRHPPGAVVERRRPLGPGQPGKDGPRVGGAFVLDGQVRRGVSAGPRHLEGHASAARPGPVAPGEGQPSYARHASWRAFHRRPVR